MSNIFGHTWPVFTRASEPRKGPGYEVARNHFHCCSRLYCIFICIINRMVFSISDLAYYCTYLIWNIVYIINKIIFIYNYRLPCFTKKVEKIKSTSRFKYTYIAEKRVQISNDILDTLQCICHFSISLDQVHWVLTPDRGPSARNVEILLIFSGSCISTNESLFILLNIILALPTLLAQAVQDYILGILSS
jgi:hypothetical protein